MSSTTICVYWNESVARRDDFFQIRQSKINDYYKVLSSVTFRRHFETKQLNGTSLRILYNFYGDCNFSFEHWLTNRLPVDMETAYNWSKAPGAIR